MKTISRLLPLLLLIALCAFAQDAPDAAPKYFVAGGVGTTPYMLPSGSLWGTFGLKVADNTYTYTNLRMNATQATLSQGLIQILAHKDGFTLGALGDLGGAAGINGIGFAVAGGGILTYDIAKWTKIPGTSVVAVLKIQKAGEIVQPSFGLGISKTF